MNSNSLQLLIVRSIEISRCLFWIVQYNTMKLSQLPIGSLLMHAKWWMTAWWAIPEVFSDMPSAYFLNYLTNWLQQLFKCFGENLINLDIILWKFCLCDIVLTHCGLQKWQNIFGVDCKSSHFNNWGGFIPVLYR